MDIKDVTNEQAVGGIAAIPVFIYLARRLLTLFKSEVTTSEAIDARGDVIELLRQEVKRLQEENQRLRRDVDELIEKLRVIRLRSTDRAEVDQIRNRNAEQS